MYQSFLIIFYSTFHSIFLSNYQGICKFQELFPEISILSTDGKLESNIESFYYVNRM